MRRAADAALFYMQILIAGGSGFIGRALIRELLKTDCKIYIYTHQNGFRPFSDSSVTVLTAKDDFPEVDAIINLSGERIDKKRLTQKRMQSILSSRLDTINLLFSKYQNMDTDKIYFIQSSATGIYKDGCSCDESGQTASTLYADICSLIEHRAQECFKQVCLARFGVVVGKGGGLCNNLKFMPKIHFTNGNNLIPWIFAGDCAKALRLVLYRRIQGPVNFCSDTYLTLNELMSLCAGISFIKLVCPKFVLNFDKRCDLLKADQRVKPSRLLREGFIFSNSLTQSDL